MSQPNNIIHLDCQRKPDPGSLPLSEQDDDSLMLLTRGGMNAAFDQLIRRHQRKALKIACKYLGDTQAAKDVCQNTFMEIYRSINQYQARNKFTAFLFRALLNQCHMAYRSKKYEERTGEILLPTTNDTDQMAYILTQEKRKEVEKALNRLSKKLRVVIVLRFGGDLSYQEIADVLELPLGTVKRRLFDGLEKLSRIVEQP